MTGKLPFDDGWRAGSRIYLRRAAIIAAIFGGYLTLMFLVVIIATL